MVPSEIPIRYARGITQHDRGSNCVRFSPIPTFATGSDQPAGPGNPDPARPEGSGGSASGSPNPVDEIGVALYHWVIDVRELLEDLQTALERAHDSAAGEERRDLSKLLARTRHCRAKVPGPEMIRAWVRYLISALG